MSRIKKKGSCSKCPCVKERKEKRKESKQYSITRHQGEAENGNTGNESTTTKK